MALAKPHTLKPQTPNRGSKKVHGHDYGAYSLFLLLLMTKILHRFSAAIPPFQPLSGKIGVKPGLKQGMCANGRNPASRICLKKTLRLEGIWE